jgi:hypothetical protein
MTPRVKTPSLIAGLLLALGLTAACSTPPLTPLPPATTRPLLLAHYMPWYQTPSVSGLWGWHWTMNHFNPNQQDEAGQALIASHYYPLTGPYDSRDEAVLEYQLALMKLSGIDGVIVDWYGIEDFWDYGLINQSTLKLFEHIQKAGLWFVICYEDQTIKHMVDNGRLSADEALPHSQKVMQFLQDNFFREAAYLKSDGRPILLTFGNPPVYFKTSADWETLFSGLEARPLLITEDDPLPGVAAGSYPWPPMWASGGGELAEAALNNYLTSFYAKAQAWDYRMAGAFPGFRDIYREAGAGVTRGYLNDRDGETFQATLQRALESDPEVIQLVTWNDYGEGTSIEPTTEFGDRYLVMLQEFRRAHIEPGFRFEADDLSLPLRLYTLRREHKGEAETQARLDEAYAAIFAGRPEAARTIADSLSQR